MTRLRKRRGGRAAGVGAVAAVWLLAACQGAAPPAAAPPAPPAPPAAAQEPPAEGVTLTPDQVQQLGLVTQPAARVEYREEAAGYGVVVGHELIAQGAAELASAEATLRQSRAALARARSLAGTPGAVSADVQDAAVQKAAVDAAALTLTIEKLTSTLGLDPPWRLDAASATLRDLASGRVKLLRATFPLGSLSGTVPATLRAARLGPAEPGSGWTMHTIWNAPADATLPGRSFFALLAGSDAGEGERLRVWAPVGGSEPGVLVPGAAAVLHDGRYWCYLERKAGTYVRIGIDVARPLADGYFVATGIAPGDRVVTAAAGLLLAKEAGAGAEPD